MSIKNSLLPLGVFAAVASATGYVLTNSVKFGICVANETVTEASCINFYERVGDPVFFGMGALAIVFFVLTFFPKAWGAWKKFATWFVPVAALIFIFYKDPGSMNLVSPYAETVFMWVSGIYIGVSLVIIARSAFKKS